MSTAVVVEPQVSAIEIVRRVSSIATLPEVTARIIATVENPKSSAAELHRIVCHDPALVTRILKVVNSAFYGLPGQIASIERAIVLLGINAVKNIAVAASLGQLFKGVKLCDGYTAKDLWTHCIAVGVTAREIARQMRVPLADEAFLAGMIHDVGLLVSLQVFPDKLRQACETVRQHGGQLAEIEQQIMGVDHQQLGAALAEMWRFPRSCQRVAGYHHQPGMLSDHSRLLVTLVYTADSLCCAGGFGFNLTAMNQPIDPSTTAAVAIDALAVERVRSGLKELVTSAASIFR